MAGVTLNRVTATGAVTPPTGLLMLSVYEVELPAVTVWLRVSQVKEKLGIKLNCVVTFLACVILTVQVELAPLQSPLQTTKLEPPAGVAVRVTEVPET